MHRKYILIYIQKDATLHNLFHLETALHVSVCTTTHHQERKQIYLQRLEFATPLLLPAVSDDVWWYDLKHVEPFPDKINCVTLRLVRRILEYQNKASSSLYIGKEITFMSVLEQNTKRIICFLAAIVAFIAGSPLSPVLSETCASIVLFISTQKRCRRMTIVFTNKT